MPKDDYAKAKRRDIARQASRPGADFPRAERSRKHRKKGNHSIQNRCRCGNIAKRGQTSCKRCQRTGRPIRTEEERQEFKRLITEGLIPIGKHKGCSYRDLPLDYLKWVADQPKFSIKRVKELCLRELERRGEIAPREPSALANYREHVMPSGKVTLINSEWDLTGAEKEEAPF